MNFYTIIACEEFFDSLYEKHGFKSLNCDWLTKNGHNEIFRIYSCVHDLNINNYSRKLFTENHHDLYKKIKLLINYYGYIPPQKYIKFQHSNMIGLHNQIKRIGGIEIINKIFNINNKSNEKYDIEHHKWKKFQEVALANWLIKHGITPKKGRPYPNSFNELTGVKSNYDMYIYTNQEYDIELWDVDKHIHSYDDIYHKQNTYKRDFNQNKTNYIEISYENSYNYDSLKKIFMNYHIDMSIEKYSIDECYKKFLSLHEIHGIKALNREWLYKNGYNLLYRTYECHHRMNTNDLCRKLLKLYNNSFYKKIKFLIGKYGFIPPHLYLKDNYPEMKGLHSDITRLNGINNINVIYNIDDIYQRKIDVYNNKWRSFPEALLSNYLISNSITPIMGEKYPDSFHSIYGKNGYYDMHFVDPKSNIKYFIEVWGGGGNRDGKAEYEKQKKSKQNFNENNSCFIELSYIDCYNKDKLHNIFKNII